MDGGWLSGLAPAPGQPRCPLTGHWNDQALQPQNLNAAAAAFSLGDNIFPSGNGGQVVSTPSAFVRCQPAPYLRPYALGGFWFSGR